MAFICWSSLATQLPVSTAPGFQVVGLAVRGKWVPGEIKGKLQHESQGASHLAPSLF